MPPIRPAAIARHALVAALFNTVLAVAITLSGHQGFGVNLLYSQLIGMTIWALIDGWLAGLGDDHFQQVLPLVRRSFAEFSRSERRSLGERAAQPPKVDAAGAAASGPDWDVARVARVLPLLHQLLGFLPREATSHE